MEMKRRLHEVGEGVNAGRNDAGHLSFPVMPGAEEGTGPGQLQLPLDATEPYQIADKRADGPAKVDSQPQCQLAQHSAGPVAHSYFPLHQASSLELLARIAKSAVNPHIVTSTGLLVSFCLTRFLLQN